MLRELLDIVDCLRELHEDGMIYRVLETRSRGPEGFLGGIEKN